MTLVLNMFELNDLFKMLEDHKEDELNKTHPELISYKETLYHIIDIYKKYLERDNMYTKYHGYFERINWLGSFLEYLKITDNKDFRLNKDVLDILGEPTFKNQRGYFFMYASLFYPDEFKENNTRSYVGNFSNLLKIIFKRDFNKELFKDNKRLYRLLEIVEELKVKYHKFYNKYEYKYIISIILSSCYINDNYLLFYNFLKNPNYYVDKLVVKGYARFSTEHKSKWRTEWNSRGIVQTFIEANDIFKEDKKEIK